MVTKYQSEVVQRAVCPLIIRMGVLLAKESNDSSYFILEILYNVTRSVESGIQNGTTISSLKPDQMNRIHLFEDGI